MHDPTEGGVATAVREIAAASGLGAIVNRALIPILDETRTVAEHFGLDPLGMLSSGSLLATVPPESLNATIEWCATEAIEVAVIGKLTSPDSGFGLIESGRTIELPTYQTDEVSRALARQ